MKNNSEPKRDNTGLSMIKVRHTRSEMTNFNSTSLFLFKTGTGNESVLKNTIMPVVSNDKCNGSDALKNQITKYMFCAGFQEGKNDACQVSQNMFTAKIRSAICLLK